MSLQELHAKSREHGSYDRCAPGLRCRFGTQREWTIFAPLGPYGYRPSCPQPALRAAFLGRFAATLRDAPAVSNLTRTRRVRLSKIDDYLVDNAGCIRLSDLNPAVNNKQSQVSKTARTGAPAVYDHKERSFISDRRSHDEQFSSAPADASHGICCAPHH